MKTIREAELKGKKVILRVDFNVPLKKLETGETVVADDRRIAAALPTIKYLIENEAKLIIISHLGRPEGKVDPQYSLDPAVLRLQELLGKIIVKCYSFGGEVEQCVADMQPGDVVVLGNLRFDPGEESNDLEFSKKLASYGDVYVNDAFAVSHRAHASVEGITHYLPSYAGFLMEKEVENLGGLVKSPEHPFVLIMGGAKAGDKIPVIKNLENNFDAILMGGAIANTFCKAAKGYDIGSSKFEPDKVEESKIIYDELMANGKEIFLPIDGTVSNQSDGKGEILKIDLGSKMDPSWMILDIGPKTLEQYNREVLMGAKTILWNGNMGMSEVKPFDEGSVGLLNVIAEATSNGVTSIVCGGDTAGLVHELGYDDKVSYISTGGGAALELLTGMDLPGIKALENGATG